MFYCLSQRVTRIPSTECNAERHRSLRVTRPLNPEVYLEKAMSTEIICLRPLDDSPLTVRWHDFSSVTSNYPTIDGSVSVKHGHLVGGKSEGVEIVLVDTGVARALLLPGRGMGIWKLWSGGIEFGWKSPVDGPVHPSQVPIMDPSGLGWLEGFDELFVRCGLASNGAPDKDDLGTLRYPLHGRIANLPARDIRVEVNDVTGCVEVIGDILETRLFFNRLRLRSRIGFHAGSADIQVIDEVTNERSETATMQMLYHINVGAPVLSAGATVVAPLETLAPKDSLAAGEIDAWNSLGGPQIGYSERVYFSRPLADELGLTAAMLRAADNHTGFGIRFDTTELPYFILWKNTAAENDGYVIGLEPATNLPNTKTFETSQGRMVSLEPGETKLFHVQLCPLVDSAAVKLFTTKIETIRAGRLTSVCTSPKAGWSV